MRAGILLFSLWLGLLSLHAAAAASRGTSLALADDKPIDLSTDLGRYQAKVYYTVMTQ